MRQALAKGVRRDLRRAFGEGVLETVDAQGSTLEGMANTVNSLRRELIALEKDHAILKQSHAALKPHFDPSIDHHTIAATRSLSWRLDELGEAHATFKTDTRHRWDANNAEQVMALGRIQDRLPEPRLGFWGRLRWLLTGA